jgi:hypothetical protein
VDVDAVHVILSAGECVTLGRPITRIRVSLPRGDRAASAAGGGRLQPSVSP